MDIVLAYTPNACSLVPQILLLEAGADFRLLPVRMSAGEHHRPEYLKLNAKGKVPTLIVDGEPLTENVAIQCWIARHFPATGLLPEDPTAYCRALSVMAWCASGIHPTLTRQARPTRFFDGPDDAGRVAALGSEAMLEQFALADAMLEGKTWFVDRFSCADAYFYWCFSRGAAFGADVSAFRNCVAHRARMEARPSVRAALEAAEAIQAAWAGS